MYRIQIHMNVSNAVPSPNWGSLMHGMLMEHLRGAWPTLLHDQAARPLSQWVEAINTRHLIWRVQIFEDPLAICFLESCQKGDDWFCQHNGAHMVVEEVVSDVLSLSDYIQSCMDYPAFKSDISIRFLTATTHKSQGEYVLFPTVPLIANSLRNRLCELHPEIQIPNEHLDLVINQTRIHQYNLQSTAFGLEGSWIKGYTGQITLRVTAPEAIIRFGNMLFGLAPWFGVGIKTALGMGGCLISQG